MQEITYINAQGKSVRFSLDPPYVLERVTGLGAVDLTLILAEPAMVNGAILHGIHYGGREIDLSIHIDAPSRQELYRLRHQFIQTINPYSNGGELGTLIYKNDYITAEIPAVCKKSIDPQSRFNNYHLSMPLTFYCPDPLWRGPEQTWRVSYLDGQFSFPLEIDIIDKISYGSQYYQTIATNDGDAPAPFKIIILGPANFVRITNMTTDERLLVSTPLAFGESLTIDTNPLRFSAVLQRANGDVESAIGHIDPSSDLAMFLVPGDNLIMYDPGNTESRAFVSLAAQPRYGGV